MVEDSEAAVDRVLKQISPLYVTVLKLSYQTRKLLGDHGKLGKILSAKQLRVIHCAKRVGRTLIGVFGGE